MKPTFVVIDNVLNSKDLEDIQKKFKSLENFENKHSYKWHSINENHEYSSLCNSLINLAGKYYDISEIIGYESWCHINTRPPGGWHYDKDEFVHEKYNIYKFPVFSIVYYPVIENLIGGELLLDDVPPNQCIDKVLEKKPSADFVVPKQNRAVIFKECIHHYVNEYQGNRYSFVMNPWITKLGIVSE